jgi:hypothetical protein
MPDPEHLFSTEYTKGSRPTEADEGAVEQSLSQTVAVPPEGSTPLEHVIETKVYGTGKPRRVLIRGKISRE